MEKERQMAVYVDDRRVSEMIGVGRQTLANWRGQGKGPRYVKLEGRLVRYALSDVIEFMESRKVEARDGV